LGERSTVIFERQVCTQRYSFQLNYARNVETTLTTADRMRGNGTSKNRDLGTQDCTVSSFTVCIKDLRTLLASALFFTTCRLHFSELKNIWLASLHSILFCEHSNECQ